MHSPRERKRIERARPLRAAAWQPAARVAASCKCKRVGAASVGSARRERSPIAQRPFRPLVRRTSAPPV